MANKIIIKKSSVAGKVPLSSDLEVGELAVNLADQALYSKNAGGTVVQLGGGSGSGDVVGPSSATDNALARFDGTTGKRIQNGTITQDDSGNLAGVNAISFATSPTTPPTAPGSLYWDSADGNQTLSLVMAGGTATQQIGEEQYYRIKASAPITNGQVVMFTGTVGASGGLTGAPATGLTASTASYVMGIATHDMATNDWGYVTSFGLVRQIDTSAFTAGDILYLNPSVAGGLTTTIPSAPNPKVQVAACIYSSAVNGSLFIRPSFGGALGQYEGDVGITSPADGNLLVRNQTAGKWVNAALTAGTGIGVTNGAGSITVSNSGVTALSGTTNEIDVSASTGSITLSLPATINADTTGNAATATSAGKWTTARTLSFTGDATGSGSVDGSASVATTLTLANTAVTAGSYTNTALTVDSKGRITAASSGTAPVTSVGATAPIQSSGGVTPTISITQASSTTNGYLSSTDWNTFNNKGSGTVTSVTGTSPVASSGGATPAISLASGYGDTQNPYASKTANYFLAAPNGTAGAPTFRAIVAADIPTLNQNTTGSSGSCTGNAATATTATNAGNADTLDGQHGAYYQPASTAITTSNIGSQSVNYATSAGSATSATSASSSPLLSKVADYSWSASTLPQGYNQGIQCSFISSAQGFPQAYGSLMTMNTYSGGGGALQMFVPYSPTYGGTGMQVRFGNYDVSSGNSWTAWKTLIASDNISSYAVTSVPAKMVYDTFTATASQTTFTASTTYTSGKIEVYANGIKMRNGTDVTVTSGTSVVFASGLAAGTLVDLVYPI